MSGDLQARKRNKDKKKRKGKTGFRSTIFFEYFFSFHSNASANCSSVFFISSGFLTFSANSSSQFEPNLAKFKLMLRSFALRSVWSISFRGNHFWMSFLLFSLLSFAEVNDRLWALFEASRFFILNRKKIVNFFVERDAKSAINNFLCCEYYFIAKLWICVSNSVSSKLKILFQEWIITDLCRFALLCVYKLFLAGERVKLSYHGRIFWMFGSVSRYGATIVCLLMFSLVE